MLLFVGRDDQLGLSDLSLKVVYFGLGFGKDVAPGGTACLQFFKKDAVFRDLLFVPFDLCIIISHGLRLLLAHRSNHLTGPSFRSVWRQDLGFRPPAGIVSHQGSLRKSSWRRFRQAAFLKSWGRDRQLTLSLTLRCGAGTLLALRN